MYQFQLKQVLLQDISARSAYGNTFSGDSDSWYFTSQMCFHCNNPLCSIACTYVTLETYLYTIPQTEESHYNAHFGII